MRPLLLAFVVFGSLTIVRADVVMRRVDGSDVVADRVDNWNTERSDPRVSGKHIFDSKNPARWVLHRDHDRLRPASAFVEFHTGDRVPGTVVNRVTEQRRGSDAFPTHFLLRPDFGSAHPREGGPELIRVIARNAKRVVWEDVGEPYTPQTAFLRDGSRLSFRSVRWSGSRLTLLLESGIRRLSTGEVAELHFERVDPFDAWFDQLSQLAADGESRIVQIVTTDGGILTGSTSRMRAETHGSRNEPKDWYHAIQPAWAARPLWVPFLRCRMHRFFAAHEVPLSVLTESAWSHRAVFRRNWRPDRDADRLGRHLLHADGTAAASGWSLLTPGGAEFAFDVPEFMTRLTVRYGLEEAVGEGGWLAARVRLGDATLHDSGPRSGAEGISPTITIDVPRNSESRTLRLICDPLLDNTPPERDPFDIRDLLVWSEPLLICDEAATRREIQDRVTSNHPLLFAWTEFDAGSTLDGWESVWLFDSTGESRWQWCPRVTEQPWLIELRLDRPVTANWVGLWAGAPAGVKLKPELHLQINEQDAIHRTLDGLNRYYQPVPTRLRHTSTDESVQTIRAAFRSPNETPVPILIGELTFSEHAPGLQLLTADLTTLAEELTDGDGTLHVVPPSDEMPSAALRVHDGSRGAADVSDWRFPIRAHPWVGEYRYMQFSWKAESGDLTLLELAHEGVFGSAKERPGRPARLLREPPPYLQRRFDENSRNRGLTNGYRFDAGNSLERYGRYAAHLDKNAPQEWQTVTRDAWDTFGDFDLTGLRLSSSPEGAMLLGPVWLAMRREDFKWVEPLPAPVTDTNRGVVQRDDGLHTRDPESVPRLVARIAPGFALSNAAADVRLLTTDAGDVLRFESHPGQKADATLTTWLTNDDPSTAVDRTLDISVGHEENRPLKLIVRLGEETLSTTDVKLPSPADRTSVSVPLSLPPATSAPLTVEFAPASDRSPLVLLSTLRLRP